MSDRCLFLMVFNPRQGPMLYKSIPGNLDDRVESTFIDVFEMSGPGYFYYSSMHEPNFNSFNHYFEVPAPGMRNQTMSMMLTLVMFDKKKPKNFRSIMSD